MALAVINDATWSRFCLAMGFDSLAADPRFASRAGRSANRDELNETISRRFGEMRSQEVVDLLNAATVPCEEVKDVPRVFESENAKAIGLEARFSHPQAGEMSAVATPYHLSQWADTIQRPPPMLGEHREEILGELGYDSTAIEGMRQAGGS